MPTWLLIGRRPWLLEALREALQRRGFDVRLAGSRRDVQDALAGAQPRGVMFDHVGNGDVEALNPRDHGFAGPLLLLTDERAPRKTDESLRPIETLEKPFRLAQLYALVNRVTPAQTNGRFAGDAPAERRTAPVNGSTPAHQTSQSYA